MKSYWINKKEENTKLIVFFNGWGMNETPFKHLKCEDYDVLVAYDYSNLDFNFSEFDFLKYKEKNLIAWSMGVYVSNLFFDSLNNFDKKIAINGTSKMIDNAFGIPKKIYDITIKLFCEKTCEKFIQNMFENEKIPPKITITRTLESLKQELVVLKNLKIENELAFDLAIISQNDKIVPSQNQLAFWENKTIIKKINSSHCPFGLYSKWTDLLC